MQTLTLRKCSHTTFLCLCVHASVYLFSCVCQEGSRCGLHGTPGCEHPLPCHHRSDGNMSGCLGDERRGRGERRGTKHQGSPSCSSVSRSHAHAVKNKHTCTKTIPYTDPNTHSSILSNLRTGRGERRGTGQQAYPSLDVLFLHVRRDSVCVSPRMCDTE